MDTGLKSRYRFWLEVILPLYTIALLYVYFRPESIPHSLSDSGEQSLFPWAVWGVVGAMSGILAATVPAEYGGSDIAPTTLAVT